jgi:hypothetical protein
MINLKPLQKRLEKQLLVEDGKPFNKFTNDAKTEILEQQYRLALKLNDEIEKHKNELVLYDNKVVRLVDVKDNDPSDYYWCYDGAKNYYTCSCVGGHTLLKGLLKGFLPEKSYQKMLTHWNLNNIEKAI